MGSLIGGAIGGVASLLGGSKAKSASNSAQQLDLTGYNYLTKGGGANYTNTAAANGVTGSNGATGTQATENALLTGQGDVGAAKTAFNNYLGSTGYNFQMDQGTRAITGSAAANGLRDSGATGKALESYGQNLGSSYFNNYLGQLGTLNGQQTATATQGQNAVSAAGGAGSSGGVAAGTNVMAGGVAQANGLQTGIDQIGKAIGTNWDGISNFFGGL